MKLLRFAPLTVGLLVSIAMLGTSGRPGCADEKAKSTPDNGSKLKQSLKGTTAAPNVAVSFLSLDKPDTLEIAADWDKSYNEFLKQGIRKELLCVNKSDRRGALDDFVGRFKSEMPVFIADQGVSESQLINVVDDQWTKTGSLPHIVPFRGGSKKGIINNLRPFDINERLKNLFLKGAASSNP